MNSNSLWFFAICSFIYYLHFIFCYFNSGLIDTGMLLSGCRISSAIIKNNSRIVHTVNCVNIPVITTIWGHFLSWEWEFMVIIIIIIDMKRLCQEKCVSFFKIIKNYINALNHVIVFFDTGTDFFIYSQLISDHCPILNLTAIPLFVKLGCA